jgi:hypothetical protein
LALALLYQLACVYECGSHGEAYGEARGEATARGSGLGGDPDAETPSQRLAQWRALRHAGAPGSNAAAEAEKGGKSGEVSGDGLGTRLREWRLQRRSGERREEGPEVVQEPDASSMRAIRQAQELGMSAAEVRALTVGESEDMLLPPPTNTCHPVLDAGGKEDNAHLPFGDAIAILLVGMTRPMTSAVSLGTLQEHVCTPLWISM